MPLSKRLIITGDDFGLTSRNNQGIIAAHKNRVLSSTSLMVGGDAVDEAVELARQHPTLAVGLHVAFSDTKPILPAEQVPLLVQSNGYFPADDAHRSVLLSTEGRRQVAAEIDAQFRAFHAIGLPMDHVDTHRHAVLHPIFAWLLYRVAAEWKAKTIRIPWRQPSDIARRLRATALRQVARMYGMRSPDQSFSCDWSAPLLTKCLSSLPHGNTELVFHPVNAQDHMFAADLPTLLDETVRSAVTGVKLCNMREALV
jgi:chitin disaccharide deacetylase